MPDRPRPPAAGTIGGEDRTRRRLRGTGSALSAASALAVVALLLGIAVIGNRLGRGDSSTTGPGATDGGQIPSSPPTAPSAAAPTRTSPSPDGGRTVAVSSVGPRSGVPAALRPRTWLAEVADSSPSNDRGSVSVAGTEGTTARIILPASELGLGADDGRVASSVVSASGGSDLLVRSIATGAVQTQFHTGVVVNHGLLLGPRLYWVGFADASRQSDGGLWVADLSLRSSEPRLVAGPLKDLRPFGANAERGPILASPSGRTLTSTIGGLKAVHLDVVDVAMLAVRTSTDGVIPLALTDDAVVALRPGGLELRDIATGKPHWSLRADLVYDVVSDPMDRGLILAVDLGDAYVIEEVDLRTGKPRKLLTQDRTGGGRLQHLVSALSTFDDLVLLSQPSLGDALGTPTGEASAAVLDRNTASLIAAAFKVGAP